MTSAIFWRLMWKEFRVQRSLWFALLFAALLLQAVISPLNDDPGQEFWGALVALGVGLGWFYALGSGAVSFASEREDGTQIRMAAMACPPAVTVSAKVVYGAITTLLFLLVSTAFATWLRPPSRASMDAMTQVYFIETTISAIVSLWFALLIAVGCSLLTRRVLSALLMAGIVTSILETILFSITLGQAPSQLDAERALQLGAGTKVVAIGMLCLVAYALARRWLNRDFPIGSPTRSRFWFPRIRFVRVRDDGTIVVPVDLREEELIPIPSIKDALQTPPPSRIRWWSAWLLGSRHRHEWRFLVWHELVGTRFWFVIGLGIAWLLTLPALFRTPTGPLVREWVYGPGIFFSVLAAWVCGFLTFRQEQTERQFLFATHRGVPPLTVWIAKQTAWAWRFCLAFVVINSVALLTRPFEFFAELLQVMDINQSLEELAITQPYLRRPLANLYVTDFFRVPSAVLMFFAIGQAASLLVRRTVVAWFVAAIGSIAVFVWLVLLAGLRVNPLSTTIPIAVSLFAATLLYCRPWMMERSSRWLVAKLATLVVLGPVCAAGLVAACRVTQVPVVEMPTERAALYGSWHDPRPDRTNADQQRIELLKPITASEEQNGKDLLLLCDRLQATWAIAGVHAVDTNVLDGRLQAQFDAVEPMLDELVSVISRAPFAFGHPSTLHLEDAKAHQVGKLISGAIFFLWLSAGRDVDLGNNERALTKLTAALSLAVEVERRGNVILDLPSPGSRPIPSPLTVNLRLRSHWDATFKPRSLGSTSIGSVLDQFIRWAAHPKTTTAMIDRALTALSEHRRLMATPEAWLTAQMAFNRAALTRGFDIDTVDQFSQPGLDSFDITTQRFLTRLPGEQARVLRYLDWLEAHQAKLNSDWGLRRNANGFGGWISQMPLKEYLIGQQADFIERTTPIVRFLRSSPLELLRYEYAERDSNLKATIIALALIDEYRGQPTPRELTLKRNLGCDLTDPWTNRPFDWWPDGLPEKMTGAIWHQSGKARSGVPLLVSPGRSRVRWQLQKVFHIPEEATAPGMSGGPGALIDGMPPGGVQGTFNDEYSLNYENEVGGSFMSLPLMIALPLECFASRSSDDPAWKSRIGAPVEVVSP